MGIIFRCPVCGARRGAAMEIVGRRIRCADCLEFVTVTPNDVQTDDAMSDSGANITPGKIDMTPPEDPTSPSDDAETQGQESERSPGPHESETPAPLPLLSAADVVEGGSAGVESSAPEARKRAGGRWKETPDDADLLDDTPSEAEPESVGFKGKVDKETIEMDMTPMVDVTFLLLIFFMVTASFTMMRTIRQPPPNSEEPSTITQENEDDPDQIIVFIDEFNTYTVLYGPVDAEAPSVQELYVRLKEAIESGPIPPTKLMIQAHGDATHEKVVIAMDAGTEVGLSEVQVMMTDKESL